MDYILNRLMTIITGYFYALSHTLDISRNREIAFALFRRDHDFAAAIIDKLCIVCWNPQVLTSEG